MGFEPTTVGFGVHCSTVGATTSFMNMFIPKKQNSLIFLINTYQLKRLYRSFSMVIIIQKSILSMSLYLD